MRARRVARLRAEVARAAAEEEEASARLSAESDAWQKAVVVVSTSTARARAAVQRSRALHEGAAEAARAQLEAGRALDEAVEGAAAAMPAAGRVSRYVRLVEEAEKASRAARDLAGEEPPLEAAAAFLRLVALLDAVARCPCDNLVAVVEGRARALAALLRARLTASLADATAAAGWPKARRAPLRLGPPHGDALRDVFRALLHHQAACMELDAAGRGTRPAAAAAARSFLAGDGEGAVLWPVEALLDPIRVRFRFHFEGGRETDRLDRPEWYLAYVADAVRDHAPALEALVQRDVIDAGFSRFHVMTEFTRGLVPLVSSKLRRDLPLLAAHGRGDVFRHTVDEALVFESRLRSEFAYPEQVPGCLEALTSAEVFRHWLRLERAEVVTRLETALGLEAPWSPLVEGGAEGHDREEPPVVAGGDEMDESGGGGGGGDGSGGGSGSGGDGDGDDDDDDDQDGVLPGDDGLPCPTRASTDVLELLDECTGKYKLLPRLADRLLFARAVQLHLAARFRRRVDEGRAPRLALMRRGLASVTRHEAEWTEFCGMANATHHAAAVLHEWGESIEFLELRFFDLHGPRAVEWDDEAEEEEEEKEEEEEDEEEEGSGEVETGGEENVEEEKEKEEEEDPQQQHDHHQRETLRDDEEKSGGDDGDEDDDDAGERYLGESATPADVAADPRFADVSGSFFGEEAAALSVLQAELLESLVATMADGFAKSAGPYRRQGFLDARAPDGELTAALAQPMATLRAQIALVSRSLAPALFRRVWRQLARRMSQDLFTGVVNVAFFSRFGARRFAHDAAALFLLFRPFTPSPDAHFRPVRDALAVMALGPDELARLRGALAGPTDAARAALESAAGVRRLSVRQAADLCERLCVLEARRKEAEAARSAAGDAEDAGESADPGAAWDLGPLGIEGAEEEEEEGDDGDDQDDNDFR